MARLSIDLKISLTADTDGTVSLFARELESAELTDTYSSGNGRDFPLAHGVSKALDLSGLTQVSFIYLESTKAIYITINGGSEIPVVPTVDAEDSAATINGKFLINSSGITSIGVRNGGTTSADDAVITVSLGY